MAEQYGTLNVEPRNQLADIELVRIPHRGNGIVVARFGPNWYSENAKSMKNHFYNSSKFPDVTFRPATTSESISDATFKFAERAKPEVYNPRWHQAGRIVRAEDGVYINPLSAITSDGVDERILHSLRDNTKPFGKSKKVIRLGANDFAFVPYESFEQGVQSAGDFAEGGLARGLEYVEGDVAVNLKSMALTYRNGVYVVNFDKSKQPTAGVVGLNSGRYGDGDRLCVDGYGWSDGDDGCASGVVVSEPLADGEAAPKK
jgi:hypothetical protein